jgi:segregation and condensation protein B
LKHQIIHNMEPEIIQNNTSNETQKQIPLDVQIESILFYSGEPVKISKLIKILDSDEEKVKSAIETLQEKLSGRGVSITEKENEVVLVTTGEMAPVIKTMKKEELSKDLSKAAIETLSIIIYRGPIKRAEIDYIRGVNSQFILRLLLIRGLIEKVTNPEDERGYLYKPSFDLLNHMGLNKIEEMPEYEAVNQSIENFINAKEENEDENVDE